MKSIVLLPFLILATPVHAGKADVVAATVDCNPARVCRFDATIRHADSGWQHYADRFEILAPDGTVLGKRTLHHPHVDEQPFTRSLGGVNVPADVLRVRVRAGDSEHGFGGRTAEVEIPR
ncbi:MAG: hypothetical protein LJE84_09070 [Gammaproteobacteria bacterium]|nr:hypothetical protein [Gammaproteobacteria bacterium]